MQNQGVIKSTSLNLDVMEQSLGLKDTIVEQLQDVFHVQFHGTLEANPKEEVDFLQFYLFNLA